MGPPEQHPIDPDTGLCEICDADAIREIRQSKTSTIRTIRRSGEAGAGAGGGGGTLVSSRSLGGGGGGDVYYIKVSTNSTLVRSDNLVLCSHM
jgi:hypothetical protein